MADIIDILDRHTAKFPVNVEAAIRELGLSLTKDADLQNGISGQIKKVGDSFEISSSGKEHYFRQRFTLAHELGHYVLHRSLIGSGIDDDTKYRSTPTGDLYNSQINDIHERQANAFAATFLIPERQLRDYLDNNHGVSLKNLSNKFQVSPSAMRWRVKNLGLSALVSDLEKPGQ